MAGIDKRLAYARDTIASLRRDLIARQAEIDRLRAELRILRRNTLDRHRLSTYGAIHDAAKRCIDAMVLGRSLAIDRALDEAMERARREPDIDEDADEIA